MEQPSPTKYKYQPLLEPDSIRVLQLHPSSDLTASPQCDLIGMRLCDSDNADHSYTAISYVWGDERDSHTISIGSSELTVGKNIHSALRHIRRRDRWIRLWVDAICINQFDLTERNHQVQQMCAIYSAAKETVIYLGDQDGGNTGLSAWNFLERKSEWAMDENGDVDYSIPAKMEQKVEFRGDLDDVEIDVLERPWFRRVWVFQEVVVSRNLSIQCGSRKISWNEFCQVLLLNARYHDRYGFSIGRTEKIDVVRDMFHARSSYQEAHGMGDLVPSWLARVENYKGGDASILNTLSRTRQLEAFDPRDKIYAVLGVSTGVEVTGELIAVNYHKPCSLVYLDFARYIMEKTHSYEVLSYLDDWSFGSHHPLRSSRHLQHSQNPGLVAVFLLNLRDSDHVLTNSDPQQRRKEYLPSWVPNWDRSDWSYSSPWNFRYTPRTVLSTLEPETESQTALRNDLVTKGRIWVNSRALVAVGVIIGEVIERSPSIAILGYDELSFQDIRDRCHDNPTKLAEEIIGQWQNILGQGELTVSLRNTLEPQNCADLSNIGRLFNHHPSPPRNSVEYHLLSRGRKSVAWSDDNNKAVAVVRDKGSIVETKRVAAYQRFNETDEVELEGLALLPSRTVSDLDGSRNLIVYLRGSRVPFLVHQNIIGTDLEHKRQIRKGLNAILQIENCTMIGECLVNGFDDIAEDCEAILQESETSTELKSGDGLPVWTPFTHGRVFLIS